MLRAQKANRVIRIPDERAKDYKALGYTVTDLDGNVVAKPDSPTERIKDLERQLAQREARIAELEKKLGIEADAGKEASGDDEKPAQAQTKKTTSTKKSTKASDAGKEASKSNAETE